MTDALSRLTTEIANHPWFWLAFVLMLAAIFVAVMQGFERRWLRTGIASLLAAQCFAVCASGWSS